MPGQRSVLAAMLVVAVVVLVAGMHGDPPAPVPLATAVGDDKAHAADREMIRKSSAEFVQAFARGDAKAIAESWTDEGEYISAEGETLRGRAAIEKAFATFFKNNPGSKIEIESTSLRFLSPDTAMEEGYLKLLAASPELPTSTHFSVLRIRTGGVWKMALAREWGADEDHLRDLDWLIGDWSAKNDDREIRLHYEWNAKKTFIKCHCTVTKADKLVTTIHQTIGRDPVLGQLRSWIFEDDGGIGHGLWSRDGNAWEIQSAGVLADGTEYTATNYITRSGPDAFVFRSADREAGGEELPDTEPFKVTRIKAGK